METLQHVAAAPLERREMSRGFIHRDNRRRYRNTNGSFADAFSYSEQNLASFPDALQYTFYCQLAHGSPTGIISGFRTVKELYRKIAECFDLNPEDIMYCTLNTHRLDVDKMLYREIGINDFLFAHIRSQPKEITIRKECASFGMTLTDTGCGVVFIKRLLPNGMMARIAKSCEGSIEIGDQIERVNNVSFLGRRHYEVANYLRAIPIGETFVLRVVSPERSPIYMLNSRTGWKGSNTSIVSGRRTIRFQGDGLVEERTVPLTEATALRRLNHVLGYYLGFEDDELAFTIYRYARWARSPHVLALELSRRVTEFPMERDMIFELWEAANKPAELIASSPEPSILPQLPYARARRRV